MTKDKKRGLIDRLNAGPVICAEGFLFEIEKRGYMSSGEFVPMVSLENPEALLNLHRDFQHAGSDIVQAFTYNCLLYTSPSPRDLSTSRMPSSA